MIDGREVVVTGLGTVYPAGCGRASAAAALRDATPRWAPVDRSAGYHRKDSARLAGLIADLDLSPWVSPRAARRMSLPSKLAVAATRMALEDAGLEILKEHRAAVVAASSFGPSSWVEKFFFQSLREGPTAASPALFPETVANAAAAHVGIGFRAFGANVTFTQREAGGLLAVARAAHEIRSGRSACALVIAVDEVTPLLHAALDRFKSLARPDKGGLEQGRPFDRCRNGFLIAEGATVLVLERESDVRRRGGRVLARLHSAANAFDPRSPRTSWSREPEVLTGALRRFLGRGGLRPSDLDAIVSGASGARAGDALEAKVLRGVWAEEPLPSVVTPKAVLGEQGGAVLAAAVLCTEGATFGPAPGFSEADPKLGVVPFGGGQLLAQRVLVTSLAAGGAAAWIVFERGDR